MATEIEELAQFLSLDTRPDVRGAAMEYLLGVSAAQDGEHLFIKHPFLFKAMAALLKDTNFPLISRDAFGALVNLSTKPDMMPLMAECKVMDVCVDIILNAESDHPDPACMLLNNLTRQSEMAQLVLDMKRDDRPALHLLVDVFCRIGYNPQGNLDYLANVFFNLTQLDEGRKQMTLRAGQGCIFQRLLPFIEYKASIIRRGGTVGVVRNCCFDIDNHRWMLSDEVNILPYLLLPLAGPEELSDEDMDGMPDELQFLPPDKEREVDSDIRKLILEALSQLCVRQFGRDVFTKKKVYPILRELHKWEPVEEVKEACEQLVTILIAEITPGVDDLKAVDTDLPPVEEMSKMVLSTNQDPSWKPPALDGPLDDI